MSLGIEIQASGIDAINKRLTEIAGIGEDSAFYEMLGSIIESQTHYRIEEEKTTPDGEAWEISEEYAEWKAKVRPGVGILEFDGWLNNSITWLADGSGVVVGSAMVYAARQQIDYGNEFLGLSEDNTDDLIFAIDKWVEALTE